MRLDIRHVNIPVSHELEAFATVRVERALRPFRANVGRVDVRVEDVNGPRGGEDMLCTVSAEVARARRTIVVKVQSSDVYAAVQAACSRLGEAVSRALTRRRHLDRCSANQVA